MDRRRFLLQSSWGVAGLCLSNNLAAQGILTDTDRLSSSEAILKDEPLRRLAFGSCNYSDRDQSYWSVIGQDEPQLWMWLGDNIYGDGLSMTQRQQRYNTLKKDKFYAAFSSKTPMIGTWDDHDYASDNQDGRYPDKVASKNLFLDFLNIDRESGILDRSGIYQSYVYGPVGQRTKVILLDLRYNQDQTRTKKILLGTEQWQWLEAELATDDFELLIIGSSINVTSPSTGFGLEGWNAFGSERQRFYKLLATVDCPTLLLSGDRHHADISRFDPGHGRPVYEFMSSGLTHASGFSVPNPYRVGKFIGERNYGRVDIDWTGIGPVFRMEVRSPVSNKVLGVVNSFVG